EKGSLRCQKRQPCHARLIVEYLLKGKPPAQPLPIVLRGLEVTLRDRWLPLDMLWFLRRGDGGALGTHDEDDLRALTMVNYFRPLTAPDPARALREWLEAHPLDFRAMHAVELLEARDRGP